MELFAKDHRDILRYYGNTYVKMPQFGDKIFRVHKVESTHVLLLDREGEIYKILLAEEGEEPFVFEYVLPHKAVFYWKNSVYRLYRRPARQYYRGCSSENTQITDCFSGRAVALSFESLEAFVGKPQYFSLADALTWTNKRTVGIPLTKRISFHLENQALYVDSKPVAVFSKGHNRFQTLIGCSLFAPEIAALVKASNLDFGIVDENLKPL